MRFELVIVIDTGSGIKLVPDLGIAVNLPSPKRLTPSNRYHTCMHETHIKVPMPSQVMTLQVCIIRGVPEAVKATPFFRGFGRDPNHFSKAIRKVGKTQRYETGRACLSIKAKEG